jgi:hypothetical protein
MPDLPRKPKHQKREVNLAGQDPIEVLKRLLRLPPNLPAAKGQAPHSDDKT